MKWHNHTHGLCVVCSAPIAGFVAMEPGVHEIGPRLTCSEPCHEYLVAFFEHAYGPNKLVTGPTGRSHLVPTRYIIEHGIRAEELPKFPEVAQ